MVLVQVIHPVDSSQVPSYLTTSETRTLVSPRKCTRDIVELQFFTSGARAGLGLAEEGLALPPQICNG